MQEVLERKRNGEIKRKEHDQIKVILIATFQFCPFFEIVGGGRMTD